MQRVSVTPSSYPLLHVKLTHYVPRKFKVDITETAEADVTEIWEYIARDKPEAATAFVGKRGKVLHCYMIAFLCIISIISGIAKPDPVTHECVTGQLRVTDED